MMKYINKMIITVIAVFTLVACETTAIDDLEPKNKLEVGNVFTDAGKVESLLNGVYLSWRNFFFSAGYQFAYSGYFEYRFGSDFFENNLDFDNIEVYNLYQEYYEMLQKANYLIYGLENVDKIEGLKQTRRSEIEGIARLNRAMAHFYLLRLYGQSWDTSSSLGIVVNMEPQTSTVPKARSTVQETYDAILSDLDFAIANAPASNVPWKMSQVTAKAVKAQVLLTLNDYQGAAQYALEVMNDGNYGLEPNYADIYYNGHESTEFLFSPYWVYFSDAGSDLFGQYFETQQALTDLSDAEVGAPDDGNPATGEGFDKRYAFDNATDLLPNRRDHGKYPYPRSRDQKGSGHHILRVGEMYLIYAEAKARLASGVDQDAVDAMNVIRLRAEMPEKNPGTKEELLEMIRIEKTLELFLEWGQPWYDMVRYHKLGDINISDFRPNMANDDRLLWPIPQQALLANNKLVQNPGYSSL